MFGTWFYQGGNYTISDAGKGCLQFRDLHDDAVDIVGALISAGDGWFQGPLAFAADGSPYGMIRVTWRKNLGMLSNFRNAGETQWGPDMVAMKGSSSPAALSHPPPARLRIASPNCQTSCAGDYELTDQSVNGQPIWCRAQTTDRWLFSNKSGCWCVGDLEEAKSSFRKGTALMGNSTPHQGMAPDVTLGTWSWLDGKSFILDSSIQVVNASAHAKPVMVDTPAPVQPKATPRLDSQAIRANKEQHAQNLIQQLKRGTEQLHQTHQQQLDALRATAAQEKCQCDMQLDRQVKEWMSMSQQAHNQALINLQREAAILRGKLEEQASELVQMSMVPGPLDINQQNILGQRDRYARQLEIQLVGKTEKLAGHFQQQIAEYLARVQQQKAQTHLKIDQQVKQQELLLAQQVNQQMAAMQQQAQLHRKELEEQQASQLALLKHEQLQQQQQAEEQLQAHNRQLQQQHQEAQQKLTTSVQQLRAHNAQLLLQHQEVQQNLSLELGKQLLQQHQEAQQKLGSEMKRIGQTIVPVSHANPPAGKAARQLEKPYGLKLDVSVVTKVAVPVSVVEPWKHQPSGADANSASQASDWKCGQRQARLADMMDEPLQILGPVTGIMNSRRLSLAEAVGQTGLQGLDPFVFTASEVGAEVARENPSGPDRDEGGSLAIYTMQSPLYQSLNAKLRARDRASLLPWFPLLLLMRLAMLKLPKFAGTVWRGIKGIDVRNKYPKGKELYWWAFSSCTKELSQLTNPEILGTQGVRTVFNIQVLSGLDITRFSVYQEAEVVLSPGTKLRVKDAMDMGGGLIMVHLEEVPVPIALFS